MAEFNQQFENYTRWVNKAPSWLTRCNGTAICMDAKGRICRRGADFMRARDEDAFPVRWVWDWQVAAAVGNPMPIAHDEWVVEADRLAAIAMGLSNEEPA